MSATELQPSDQTLVVATRLGDKDAFTLLVDRHFRTVWTIAYARLREQSCADDLAQEVFLIAFLHLKSLSDPKRFAGWLAGITRNRVMDWLRHKQRSSKLVAMVPLESLGGAAIPLEEPELDRDEEHQKVRDAIFTLPVEQREIVLLRFAEGLNHTEIARRLEVHPVTVGRQLEKAMATLRGSLESVVEESVRDLKPARRAVLKTAGFAAAVAGMSSASRAALVTATGHMAAPAGISLVKGALLMAAAEKLKVAVIAAVVLILGLGVTVMKMRVPAPPSTPPVVAAAALPNAIPEPDRAAPAAVEPVKAAVQVPVAATVPADQFTGWVNFSDGSTVELLGIQVNPLTETKWWKADGTFCPMPPHRGRPQSQFNPGPGSQVVWMIMRLNAGHDEEAKGMKVELVPAVRNGLTTYSGGNSDSRSLEATAVLSSKYKSAELRVGRAVGPWQNEVTYDVASKSTTASSNHEGWVTGISVSEEDGQAVVQATWVVSPINQRDRRIIAMSLDKPVPLQHSSSNSLFSTKCYFNCGKGEITQVLFQSCPYEIKSIKNISLVPTTSPTHVEISAVPPTP